MLARSQDREEWERRFYTELALALRDEQQDRAELLQHALDQCSGGIIGARVAVDDPLGDLHWEQYWPEGEGQ